MAKSFEIDGKEYKSIKAIGEAFQKSPRLISARLAKGMSIEEAAKTPVKPKGQYRSKPVKIDDVCYASFKDACEKNRTNRTTAIARINAGYSEKDAITLNREQLPNKRFEFEYEGKYYKSKAECITSLGLSHQAVLAYARRHGIDIKEAIKHYLHKK